MIFRSLADISATFGPCVTTIGNFDGVHRGHQQIIRRIHAIARENGWKPAVLTFEPHPTKLVAPVRAPRLLTTSEERARRMEELGIEQVVILPFTQEIAQLAPEDFVRRILVHTLHVKAVLVGENFRFGRRTEGDAHMLEQLGRKYGFRTEIITSVVCRGRVISSTEIRRCIESGEVSLACRMLGQPYALQGKVVHGEGRGSKQTVPTLNLDTDAEVLPKTGVYITRTRDRKSGREWPSITNVGYRPTFNGHGLTVETYLLSELGGTTPEEVSVQFLRRVREEKKFENAEALKAQILRDVGRAQAYFRRIGPMIAPAR